MEMYRRILPRESPEIYARREVCGSVLKRMVEFSGETVETSERTETRDRLHIYSGACITTTILHKNVVMLIQA